MVFDLYILYTSGEFARRVMKRDSQYIDLIYLNINKIIFYTATNKLSENNFMIFNAGVDTNQDQTSFI